MEHIIVKVISNQDGGMIIISNVLAMTVEFNLFQPVV